MMVDWRATVDVNAHLVGIRAKVFVQSPVLAPVLVENSVALFRNELCPDFEVRVCRGHMRSATGDHARMPPTRSAVLAATFTLTALAGLASPATAGDDPDLVFRKSTTFKLLTPNDKLATYGIDDPIVEGVACHYTVPVAVLQEDADRARLRFEAQRARLHGLYGQARRRLAEELHLDRAGHAVGCQWRRTEMRGFRQGVSASLTARR